MKKLYLSGSLSHKRYNSYPNVAKLQLLDSIHGFLGKFFVHNIQNLLSRLAEWLVTLLRYICIFLRLSEISKGILVNGLLILPFVRQKCLLNMRRNKKDDSQWDFTYAFCMDKGFSDDFPVEIFLLDH